jgi:hypothetical protein
MPSGLLCQSGTVKYYRMTTNSPSPAAAFDWALYADATFAGLSILIPVPFLDSVFESYFERRSTAAVARRAGRRLAPEVMAALHRDEGGLTGCLLWPVTLAWSLVKRVSKKLLYFLTVKEAADKLSYYWHRAFLLDYMLDVGHLDHAGTAEVGRQALAHTLNTAGISPLTQLARQVASGPQHIWRSLRRVRRGQADPELQAERTRMAQMWASFGAYLAALAERYDRAYAQALATRLAHVAAAEEAARRRAEEAEAAGIKYPNP